MAQTPSRRSASPRGRAAALLLATAAVVLVFTGIALVNPSIGGQQHSQAAWTGAAVFTAVFVAIWLRAGRLPGSDRGAGLDAGAAKKTVALAVIAGLLWLLAATCWFLAASGTNLRYGMDPVLFAVPLTIYPLLVLGAGKLPHGKAPNELEPR